MRRPRVRMEIPIDGTWDLETSKWDEFVLGGLYHKGRVYIYDWTQEDKYFEHLLKIDGTLLAHNSGRFDNLWALKQAIKRKLSPKVMESGSAVFSVKIANVRLLDSYKILPMSLRDATESQGVSKSELGPLFPCICLRECGGYCSISRQMSKAQMQALKEYLRADLLSLYQALIGLRDYCREHQLDMRATIGASAWASAARFADLPDAEWAMGDYKFAHSALTGGRCQTGRIRELHRPVYARDVNSMYPFILSNEPLPWGKPKRRYGRDSGSEYGKGKAGFYRCTVKIPEMLFPPLPVHTKDRVAYPWGEVTGTWAFPELENAERVGCEITEFEESLTYDETRVILKDWYDQVFKLRREAPGGKKSPLGTWMKLLGNSFYGKTASSPWMSELVLNPTLFDLKQHMCPCKGIAKCTIRRCPCCERGCKGVCGAYTRLHPSCTWAWEREVQAWGPHHHIEWGNYTTSGARVKWYKGLEISGFENFLMGDTDSLYTLGQLPADMVGNELGQWEDGGAVHEFDVKAPKVYRYRDEPTEKNPSGLVVKAKGLYLPNKGLGPKAWEAYDRGVSEARGGVYGLRSSIKKHNDLFIAVEEEPRQLRGDGIHWGDRTLTADGVSTRPPHSSELEIL